MIQRESTVVQFSSNTAITVSSLVFVEYSLYFSLDQSILIHGILLLAMVVVCCLRQLSDFQQNCQIVFSPQFLDHLCFLLWCRSSSKTKACNFFRYAFSARNRWTSFSRSSSTSLGNFVGRPLLPRPRRSIYSPSGPSVR